MIDVRLADYERVVFFTGAGMSAESGVPTYRGKGGTWSEYDPEQVACQAAFERDPEHVWAFHNLRREAVAKCIPNSGHAIVAAAERALPSVTVVTQNIDGLHQLAGSKTVHELHGSLWGLRCGQCSWRGQSRAAPLLDLKCPDCGAYKRPDIVWFGDMLRMDVIQASQRALETCDLLVSIGTSAVVYPAAQLPLIAKQAGARLVEINPEPTPLSDAYEVLLRGPATEMLARITDGL